MPLISVKPSLTFEIWAIDFTGPFPIPSKRIGARYIINGVEYVTKWEEAKPVDTCCHMPQFCKIMLFYFYIIPKHYVKFNAK